MAPKYGDFTFDKSFGFTGSAAGRHDSRVQPTPPNTEYGDGLKKGGHIKGHAMGGPIGADASDKEPTISMPASTAMKTAQSLVRIGMAQGARGRRGAPMPGPAAPVMAPPAPPPPRPGALGAMPGGAPGPTAMRKGGHMTAAKRHALPKSDFALPGERYPVDTANRARNALARVSQHGTPSEKAAVRAKVHHKFPDIGKK